MNEPDSGLLNGTTWFHDLKNRAIQAVARNEPEVPSCHIERFAKDVLSFFDQAMLLTRSADSRAELVDLLSDSATAARELQACQPAQRVHLLRQLEAFLTKQYNLGRGSLLYKVVDRRLMFGAGADERLARAIHKVLLVLMSEEKLAVGEICAEKHPSGGHRLVLIERNTSRSVPLNLFVWTSTP